MSATRLRRAAALYLGGHAVIAVLWWVAVLHVPRIRGWFEMDTSQSRTLNAFFLGDMGVIVVLSCIAAVALWRGSRSGPALAAAVAGGSAYATLYIANWVIAGGHGWIGVAAMTAETAIMVAFCVALTRVTPS